MKYGFIGTGNMARSFIKGMINAGSNAADILVYDKDSAKSKELAEVFGVLVADSAGNIAESVDIVFLAVKPNVLESVLGEIREVVTAKQPEKRPLLVSMAAGKTIELISRIVGEEAAIIRSMPNLNAEIGESLTAYTANENVTDDVKAAAVACFNSIGKSLELEERLFSAFTAIGGAGPAFVFMFIDALARAALKNGMDKPSAMLAAVQTVIGSAKLLEQSSRHPRELVDMVCSPGGVTIEGVSALVRHGFEHAVMSAVDAATNKDKLLGITK